MGIIDDQLVILDTCSQVREKFLQCEKNEISANDVIEIIKKNYRGNQLDENKINQAAQEIVQMLKEVKANKVRIYGISENDNLQKYGLLKAEVTLIDSGICLLFQEVVFGKIIVDLKF